MRSYTVHVCAQQSVVVEADDADIAIEKAIEKAMAEPEGWDVEESPVEPVIWNID